MKIYKILYLIFFFSIAKAIDVGFVVDGSSGGYYTAVSEATDGTFTIQITDAAGQSWSTAFYIKLDYSSSDGDGISTANRWNGDNAAYGQGYWQDFYAASSGDNALQVTATTGAASTAGFFSINPTNNSGERYWTVYVTSNGATGNGTYTFQMPVNQDARYEGGSSTYETIEMYLDVTGSAFSLESGANEFVYRITDDDAIPVYQFENTGPFTFTEGDWIQDVSGNPWKIVATTNSAGAISYVGHNDFVISYAISHTGDYPTVAADHYNTSGTITITESNNNNREFTFRGTQDGIDEPNETFDVSLSESSSFGDLGSQTSISNTYTDHADDAPPYVKFSAASTTVDEATGNITVTVSAELNAGSGYANPSVPYEVSLSSTASPTGSDYPDHNLASDVLVLTELWAIRTKILALHCWQILTMRGLIMMHQLLKQS